MPAALVGGLLVVAACLAFPGLASPQSSLQDGPEFEIISPADGSIVSIADQINTTTLDLSVSYVLRGWKDARRVCFNVRRGPLLFYRGPMLDRTANLSRWADGCFEAGGPVTLQRLPLGRVGGRSHGEWMRSHAEVTC